MLQQPWLNIDPSLAFTSAALGAFVDLWHGWRGDRAMPCRRDFGPHDLRGHLGWVLLIDVEHAPARFRYRLIGTNINAAAGRDSTGSYLDEVYPGDIYDDVERLHRLAVESCRPVRSFGYMAHVERGFVDFEAVEVPLAADERTVDMLMMRVHVAGFVDREVPR